MIGALAVDVSWLGVLVGALALFVLGGVWFTALFGKAYRRELGVAEPAEGESPLPPGPALGKALLGQFIAGLVIAFALAWLIGNSSAGHGAGKSTAMVAAEWADLLAFAAHHTHLIVPPEG